MRILLTSGNPEWRNWHLHQGGVIQGFKALGHEVDTWGPHDGLTWDSRIHPDPVPIIRLTGAEVFFALSNQTRAWHQTATVAKECPGMPIVVQAWDLHYEPTTEGFKDATICLVAGHNTLPKFDGDPRAVYHPFSINPEDYRGPLVQWGLRRKRVFFAGSATEESYPVRRAAKAALEAAGLLTERTAISPSRYVRNLVQYQMALACSSRYAIQPAKLFEYGAAGVLPLFDDPDLARIVLPGVLGYTPKNVVRVVQKALSPQGQQAGEQLSAALRRHVFENHTHAHRAQRLLKLIQDSAQ